MIPRRLGIKSVGRKRSILIKMIIGTLIVGVIYGAVYFYRQVPAPKSEIMFSLIGLLGVIVLFRRGCFFSSTIAMVFTLIFISATVIITEVFPIQFNIEQSELVFFEPLKSQALHAFLVFNCLFSALLLWGTPKSWPWPVPTNAEKSFGKVSSWLLLVLSLVLTLLNIRGPLITQAAYHSDEYIKALVGSDAGVQAMSSVFLMGSVCAALRGYGPRHANFYFILISVVSMVVFFNLLRGQRSEFFGFLIFLAVLYYSLSKARYKIVVILLLAPVAFIFILSWASVRGDAVEQGIGRAVLEGASNTWQDIKDGSIMKMDKLPKATWDMLETSFLYERGIRRNGETYLNLISQRIPSFVAETIGYERPESEPWVLAKYFQHGGGIFMVAEAYWNYGLGGAIGLAVVLAYLCIAIEKFYRRLPPILYYGYYGCIVISASNLFTGVQAFVRGIEIPFFMSVAGWLLLKGSEPKRSRSSSTPDRDAMKL